jgi:ubiquinone/menaquinone biosynthesis C-methylase UbiE
MLLDLSMESKLLGKARTKNLASAYGSVLEVGFGTGQSLTHYPPTVEKISTVDKNTVLNKKAQFRINKASISVKNYIANAEKLPFVDNSFDCVVSHMTLCTIADVNTAMNELYRVLKTGGKFFFLEHGACPDVKIKRWQDRWNPIQNIIGGGCNCNRYIDQIIASSGLKIIELENYHMGDAPKILDYMFEGVAIKERKKSGD